MPFRRYIIVIILINPYICRFKNEKQTSQSRTWLPETPSFSFHLQGNRSHLHFLSSFSQKSQSTRQSLHNWPTLTRTPSSRAIQIFAVGCAHCPRLELTFSLSKISLNMRKMFLNFVKRKHCFLFYFIYFIYFSVFWYHCKF